MQPGTGSSGRRPSFIEEARRSQVVSATSELVAEVGYANASLAKIAEHAGISKSVISYHFPGGKDELMTLVATTYFEAVWAHMEPQLARTTTASEWIGAWITSQLEFFAADRTGFIAMADVYENHRKPDGTRAFAGAEEEDIQMIAGVLARGQAAGEFRDFDPRVVATIISRSADGVVGAWMMDPEIDIPSQRDALIEFIDHAIKETGA